MAMWQPGMMSLAVPLHGPDGALRALNLSFPCAGPEDARQTERYADQLLQLARRIRRRWGVD